MTSITPAVTLAERIARMIDGMPAGSAITLSVDVLAEWLKSERLNEPSGVYSLEQLAARYDRSISTARGWCQAGLLPGAYKLNGKEWRIPVAAIPAFEEMQSQPRNPAGRRRAARAVRAGARRPVNTSAWRNL